MLRFRNLVAAALMAALLPLQAIAGTTGGVTGHVTDSQTQAPLAGVTVTANSPSQSATTATDAAGIYHFLSLPPDTYTISFQLNDYDQLSQAGVTVLSDQTQTQNASLVKTLRTIAKVTSRAAGNLLKPGTTSDVYSINAAAAAAAASLVGPGGLSNAYGAIASVPGVVVDPGEAGWFQQVHIRGGDIDQVGYELDGIPVNRVYDNAPQTMLSSLGQQELQVYTGGTPASADAQGIAGYVNQVVKTGTYPGFATANLTVGAPAFFHRASAEAGGSTPDRLFSYYVGLSGANQDYRYLDNSNGAGAINYFFYPVNTFAGGSGVYVGGDVPNLFAPGNTFGIATTNQRDNVVNFHWGIPHKKSSLRDDVQFLYLTSEVFTNYYSSVNDIGVPVIQGLTGGTPYLTFNDGPVYNGPSFAPITSPSQISPYYFPSSIPHPFNNGVLPTTARDYNDNGVAISKLQYQHAFNDRSFMRIYGYMLYSNWFIYGPNSAQQAFGAELADYEIPDHSFGGNLTFTDQISQQHLVSLSASSIGANLQRYSNGFIRGNPNVATLVSPAGNCYDKTSGAQTLCYAGAAQLGAGTIISPSGGIPAPTGAAAANGAQWLATSTGLIANLNQVDSRFSAVSLTDEWRPSDHMVVNLGARVENFKYLLGNTSPNDPARSFWFANYNKDYCLNPLTESSPVLGSGVDALGNTICSNPGESTLAALGPAYQLVNKSGGTISTTRLEPRFSFTYTLNRDTVLRGSYGVYARPQNTSWVQYNTVQQDLPTFLGSHFYSYGFRSPEHDIRPDTSNNADISLEKRLHGTDWSYKLTPFYRSTRDQLQNFFIDPLTGLESGLNVGHQVSTGVELAIQKGDFGRDGWSGQLGFTYTHSRIKYGNFDNSNINVIDNLNNFIQQYNSYTSTCTGANPTPGAAGYNPLCGGFGGSHAQPTFPGSSAPTIANPYYNADAQPLLDRSGWYTTYDVIPGPYSAENGYETPYSASLILNYKAKRFAITPSFTLTSGAKYGAPLAWPGYYPDQCGNTLSGTNADPATCSSSSGLPLFIPDVYTGKFDNLGDFREPWRFQASVSMSYDFNAKTTGHLTFTNLIDKCGQRGYAWDQPNVCVYGALPSGIFPPAGNFYPNSNGAAPPQMKYPYSFLLNNNNTGFVGTTLPMQITFDLQFKL